MECSGSFLLLLVFSCPPSDSLLAALNDVIPAPALRQAFNIYCIAYHCCIKFFFFKACLLLELALLLQFCYYFILMRCDCSYLGIIFLCYALLSTTTAYVSLPNTTSSICINCWFLKGCAAEIGKMVWAGCWWWLKWWDWAEKSNGGILVRVLSTDWYCWTMEWLWSNEMIAGRDSRWC